MKSNVERVMCLHPDSGKQGTRILKWKYDLIRHGLQKMIPASEEGIAFSALPGFLEEQLSPLDLARLGSLTWCVVTVKLDMEARGEIERVSGIKPQHVRRRT